MQSFITAALSRAASVTSRLAPPSPTFPGAEFTAVGDAPRG